MKVSKSMLQIHADFFVAVYVTIRLSNIRQDFQKKKTTTSKLVHSSIYCVFVDLLITWNFTHVHCVTS